MVGGVTEGVRCVRLHRSQTFIDHKSNTMSKRQGVLTKNLTIFFQMQDKLKTCHLWEIIYM